MYVRRCQAKYIYYNLQAKLRTLLFIEEKVEKKFCYEFGKCAKKQSHFQNSNKARASIAVVHVLILFYRFKNFNLSYIYI